MYSANKVFELLPRFATRVNSLWMQTTFGFARFPSTVRIHWTCDIKRSICHSVSLGENTELAPHVWLNVVGESQGTEPKIVMSKGCKIGRRATISSKNRIVLMEDVLLGPSVLIMDHNHEFRDPTVPIQTQGVTEGGRITIEQGCWLGHGAAIVCSRGELVVGRNSVVAANAVVTKSVPPYSVIGGNPARILKTCDRQSGVWSKPNE